MAGRSRCRRIYLALAALISVAAFALGLPSGLGVPGGPVPLAAQARVCPPGSNVLAIAYGEVVRCALGGTGEADQFTFSGKRGERVFVRAVKTSGTLAPTLRLLRPNGTILCSASSFLPLLTCLLDATGTHTIRVADQQGTGTGAYNLSLQRLNPPVGCVPVGHGDPPAGGSIDVAAEFDCFTFAGQPGERVHVRRARISGTLAPTLGLLRPNGTTLCSVSSFEWQLTCVLDTAGPYAITVADQLGTGTGGYNLYLQRLNPPTGCVPIAFGETKTGSIDVPPELDCYVFAGAAGQQVRVERAALSGTLAPTLGLLRPNGTTLCSASAFVASITCVLDATDQHTITLGDQQPGGTGRYRVTLRCLSGPCAGSVLLPDPTNQAATAGP